MLVQLHNNLFNLACELIIVLLVLISDRRLVVDADVDALIGGVNERQRLRHAGFVDLLAVDLQTAGPAGARRRRFGFELVNNRVAPRRQLSGDEAVVSSSPP